MTVRVRFFASLRERLGRSEAEWTVPADATVDDLWRSLCDRFPQLAELSTSIAFAVNHEYVDRTQPLASNDEVALIPPVSGGT